MMLHSRATARAAGPAGRPTSKVALRAAVAVAAASFLAGCGQGVRSTGAAPADGSEPPSTPVAAVVCSETDGSVQEAVAQGLSAGWSVVDTATTAGPDGAIAVAVRARKPDNFGAFVHAEGLLVAPSAGGSLSVVGAARFWKAGDGNAAPGWLPEAAQQQLLDCVG